MGNAVEWTTTPPTVPGDYWWRHDGQEPAILHLNDHGDGLMATYGGGLSYPLDVIGGEWWPIALTPPGDATTTQREWYDIKDADDFVVIHGGDCDPDMLALVSEMNAPGNTRYKWHKRPFRVVRVAVVETRTETLVEVAK